uniref:ATP synthase F0 subunit 8 n=1 Tax=Grandidierella osakaensis TaxID=2734914 RepID=A0A6J4D1B8_9CRUS|nr:ATP synthase F0 subunit 8 [Grandidierella osakaensis]
MPQMAPTLWIILLLSTAVMIVLFMSSLSFLPFMKKTELTLTTATKLNNWKL